MAFDYDILVIGGGINGCGVARDAAGRGYKVLLAEMNDLASGTSSASTKLIHGGLRYLEHYEFRLVRESLMEREVLWQMAPHIIWPLRFVLPHHKGLRPAWLLRLGLFLYDHIGGRKRLPPTSVLDLSKHPAGRPLKDAYAKGFEYSDAWVQDARMVVLNARDAADRGAKILTRSEVVRVERRDGGFVADIANRETGTRRTVSARLVVNAAGPWVDRVIGLAAGGVRAKNVRLVQGSHVVVQKLFDHDKAYIFQNTDKRIIFAIPYEGDFTLIGTTDRDFRDKPEKVAISKEETAYLCAAASDYFRKQITPSDVVWSYSGIRPLYEAGTASAQEATRDYVLKDEGDAETGAIINVFGGKITTYRRLAESVLGLVEKHLGPRKPSWTAGATLPGGDFPLDGFEGLVAKLTARAPFVADATIRRLARNYGTKAFDFLEADGGLGRIVAADLGENEIRYLVEMEWARSAEDILWRRSKLGLRCTPDEVAAVTAFLAGQQSGGKVAVN
ncbi:glycerol-3-phosphate dehydrogenase [Sinorhizobium sp. BG8]|uniref:glycerol-3-phosphate dehydrogenase n=1 Tax=Sinorhizobium sp. BG8 TaxID=2613773 RepID=UPI00193CB52A|nr:glycerol-3-phosphate dehydrogenase [Sinorhizobium sp. BG8]QRM57109.1 glycerol-3-phosphate dehydrogenase [Sinorhizobium sp. BG8]